MMLDDSVNEVHLWHGCQNSVAQQIAEKGFEQRDASPKGLYGMGITWPGILYLLMPFKPRSLFARAIQGLASSSLLPLLHAYVLM